MQISAPQQDLQGLTWISGALLPTALNGGTIFMVQASGSGSILQWWDESSQRTTIVSEDPTAVAALFSSLYTVTDTTIGAIYLNAQGSFELNDTASGGCKITYSNGGLPEKDFTVSESTATVQTLINQATPSGNFVTTDTAQTITGQKTFTPQQIFTGGASFVASNLYAHASGIAAAGTTQGTATALTKENSVITTGTQLQGAVLPTTAGGENYTVENRIAGKITIYLYPASGDNFEGLAANVPVAVPAGWGVNAVCAARGVWRVNWMAYSNPQHVGVTAHAGGGQGSAVELQGLFNSVSTVATVGDSVKVMPLAQYPDAAQVVIRNKALLPMDLFPATGENLGPGANIAYSIPASSYITLQKISETEWHVIDGQPLVIANGTEMANAVTANGQIGTITTSALTTTGGGTYVITLSNSYIKTSSTVRISAPYGYSATLITNGIPILYNAAPGSGSIVLTLYNAGAGVGAAFAGTFKFDYQVI